MRTPEQLKSNRLQTSPGTTFSSSELIYTQTWTKRRRGATQRMSG